jgi:hypothetical protein
MLRTGSLADCHCEAEHPSPANQPPHHPRRREGLKAFHLTGQREPTADPDASRWLMGLV